MDAASAMKLQYRTAVRVQLWDLFALLGAVFFLKIFIKNN